MKPPRIQWVIGLFALLTCGAIIAALALGAWHAGMVRTKQREELKNAVNESVGRTGKRLDAIEAMLKSIAREVVPEKHNTSVHSGLELRR